MGTATLAKANAQWACYLNTRRIDSLANLYMTDAVKVDDAGWRMAGTRNILAYYANFPLKIDSLWTIFNVVANANKRYEYEIGAFRTSDNRTFKQLVIWNIATTHKTRVFEFIAPSENVGTDIAQINKRREKWMELCNLHDAKTLVTQLYTSNAVYYNHKPVIIGFDAIAAEYGYMNNKNYQLTLNPITVEFVNDELAFEIGQCEGGYNGKYVLIWQRNDLGEWRILVDSNI